MVSASASANFLDSGDGVEPCAGRRVGDEEHGDSRLELFPVLKVVEISATLFDSQGIDGDSETQGDPCGTTRCDTTGSCICAFDAVGVICNFSVILSCRSLTACSSCSLLTHWVTRFAGTR